MIAPEILGKRKPVRKRRRRCGMGSPCLNLLVITAAAAVLSWFYTLPAPIDAYPLEKTLEAPTERELIIQTADGKPFARRGGCLGSPITMHEVPVHFVDALLAMEDRRFYRHFGIDPKGILRAAIHNYNTGQISQGGSTITQQLAKITYLSRSKTLARKLEEAVVSLRLEAALTKSQILERYLNRVYFGKSCYGLRGAARHYFGRKVGDLTIAESAYLVALLKSPAVLANNPDLLRQREARVLAAMVEDGRLDAEKRKLVKPANPSSDRRQSVGAYYADWVTELVQQTADDSYAALPVKTSFLPSLQHAAEESIATILKRSGTRRKAGQAALVAMRPDGRVLAMVGGVDYKKSQFNRATKALRQPGSSFKSFVYLATLRAGGRPDMLISDEPIAVGDYRPENYSHSYRGYVTLQKAFSSSINSIAVRLSEALGRGRVVAAARDLGIKAPLHTNPSIALGTAEVTLLELTSAYAAFSANAYPVKPWGILSIGHASPSPAGPPAGAGAWQLAYGEMMRGLLGATVNYGTGMGARISIPAYGKTGTSQNYRDAWFVGFAGNLVVGVWVGNDNNSPMRQVTGGSLPAQIWQRFMSRARRNDPHFQSRLPLRVAGFRSKMPHHRNSSTDTYAFRSVLFSKDEMMSAIMSSGEWQRLPTTFGYLPEVPVRSRSYLPGRWRPYHTRRFRKRSERYSP